MYIYSIKFRSYIADVAIRILEVCPTFAPKTDDMGLSALHYACSGDNLEITKMLLGLDPGLAVKFDNNSYTPLHLAAMKAKDAILEEFLAMVPTSFQLLTREGETVFHLTVRFNRFNAFVLSCVVSFFIFPVWMLRKVGNEEKKNLLFFSFLNFDFLELFCSKKIKNLLKDIEK